MRKISMFVFALAPDNAHHRACSAISAEFSKQSVITTLTSPSDGDPEPASLGTARSGTVAMVDHLASGSLWQRWRRN